MPALPDLRYPLSSTYEARVSAGLNCMPGLISDDAIIRPETDGYTVPIKPAAQRWAKERPLVSRIRYLADGNIESVNRIIKAK